MVAESFDAAPPKKQRLQLAVLSRAFKFRILIPSGMLSQKTAMLLLNSGELLLWLIRMITVCHDTDLATFIFLVVDVPIFHIVVNSNSARFCSIRFWLTLTEVVGVSVELCNLSFNFWSRWSSSSISNISPIALLSTLTACFCFLFFVFCICVFVDRKVFNNFH